MSSELSRAKRSAQSVTRLSRPIARFPTSDARHAGISSTRAASSSGLPVATRAPVRCAGIPSIMPSREVVDDDLRASSFRSMTREESSRHDVNWVSMPATMPVTNASRCNVDSNVFAQCTRQCQSGCHLEACIAKSKRESDISNIWSIRSAQTVYLIHPTIQPSIHGQRTTLISCSWRLSSAPSILGFLLCLN